MQSGSLTVCHWLQRPPQNTRLIKASRRGRRHLIDGLRKIPLVRREYLVAPLRQRVERARCLAFVLAQRCQVAEVVVMAWLVPGWLREGYRAWPPRHVSGNSYSAGRWFVPLPVIRPAPRIVVRGRRYEHLREQRSEPGILGKFDSVNEVPDSLGASASASGMAGGSSPYAGGHFAFSRSAAAASWASRTTLAWSSAAKLPDRRRMRPSTITVSILDGWASDTSAS